MKRNTAPQVERRVALCYIRLSQTKNESDLKSPERQKANLQAACDKYGWIPEWYADADKHKTGTKENNRPQWLLLKARVNVRMSRCLPSMTRRGRCVTHGVP